MKKIMLLLSLCLMGCSKPENERVGGPYTGYFGDEYARNKVGVAGSLSQQGDQVTGNLTLSTIVGSDQLVNACTVEGKVEGAEVKLKFHGVKDPLEIELTGKHTAEDHYYFIKGQATLVKGEGQIPRVFSANKKGDATPFTFKTDVTLTDKKT